jgi:putative FmdB family regulatory protein
MPTYEYRRPDGTTFEIMQPISDEALTVDPETGVPVQRVLSPVAIHFKGKGFYNTDYGTRKRQRENAASSSSEGSSGGGEKKAEGGAASESSGSGEKPKSGESKSSGESAKAAAA